MINRIKIFLKRFGLLVSIVNKIYYFKAYLRTRIRIFKAQVRRFYWDFGRKKITPPLRSPLDIVFLSLAMKNLLPDKLVALDLFGDHGLKTSLDYTPFCEKVDLWDINPLVCKIAKKIHKNNNIYVHQGDSILALQNGCINEKYNLVLIDNPPGVYGQKTYCENFEIFPKVFDVLHTDSILILNVFLDLQKYCDNHGMKIPSEWLQKRKIFFQKEDVSRIAPYEMIQLYMNKVPDDDFTISDAFLIPRSPELPWLVMCLKRKY